MGRNHLANILLWLCCAGCHSALPFDEHKALQDGIIISFSRKRDSDVVEKRAVEDARVKCPLMPSFPVSWLCSHVRQSKVTLKASLLPGPARPKHHHASNHPNQSWQLWLTLPSPARLPSLLVTALGQVLVISHLTVTALF